MSESGGWLGDSGLLTRLVRSGYVRLAVLTAIAATVAFIIGTLLPMVDPVPAAITAVVATRPTFHHAAKESIFQVIGVLAGALLAFGAIAVIGMGPLTIALLVIASFVIVRVLRIAAAESAGFAAMSVAVTVILVVGTHLSPEGALERFLGVVVGAVCALIASYFTTRGEPVGRVTDELDEVQTQLADLLADIAAGVKDDLTPERSAAWYAMAVRLRDETLRLAVTVQDIRQHRRWSPVLTDSAVQRVGRQLARTQVMATRVLAIAVEINQLMTSPEPSVGAEQLSPLASVFEAAAASIADPSAPVSSPRTGVQRAIQGAEDTDAIVVIGGLAAHAQRIARLRETGQGKAVPQAPEERTEAP